MELKRFFTSAIVDNVARLTGDEFYHCTKVTRHKVGFTIIVCTNDGYDYYAKIDTIEKDFLTATVYKKELNATEVTGKFVLYQAVCKELDFIVQKAVELGVTKIVPFYSANTNVTSVKKERLEKIVLEAAKQCGRATLTEVGEPVRFDKAIELSRETENRILCYENCRLGSIAKTVAAPKNELSVFIGSEGGFSEQEVFFAKEKGLKIVTLGKRILRAETAAVVALTLSLAAMGEF